jgi:RNA polymerase sigma-70 factor (ECF subfamily)
VVQGPDRGLLARFLAALPPERRAAAHDASLHEALATALEAARAAWPQVALDPLEFAAHLAGRLPDAPDLIDAIGQLHAADLYLACACALGEPRALACFDEQFLAPVGRTWGTRHPLADFADEVRQALRVRLLVSDGGGPPRIAGYSGRGPLAAWVRMAATRLGLDLRRRERPGSREEDELTLEARGDDPELEYLKTRYAAELSEALKTTLAALSSRTANVLRLHYQEGMTVDAIGTMYRVSGRTVQRWLAEARRTILAETRRLLSERLGLTDSRLDSLIGLVRSRLDISISQYLVPRSEPS